MTRTSKRPSFSRYSSRESHDAAGESASRKSSGGAEVGRVDAAPRGDRGGRRRPARASAAPPREGGLAGRGGLDDPVLPGLALFDAGGGDDAPSRPSGDGRAPQGPLGTDPHPELRLDGGPAGSRAGDVRPAGLSGGRRTAPRTAQG